MLGAWFSVVGYDSDDEYEEEGLQYTHRNKGKKYSKLAKDDSEDRFPCHTGSQYSDSDTSHSHLHVDSVSMYGDSSNAYMFTQDSHSERRNSESVPSSEDCASDTDHTTKHVRKEGGISGPFVLIFISPIFSFD